VKAHRLLVLATVLLSISTIAGGDGPLQFYSVIPCRIIDTRFDGGPITSGQTRSFAIGGTCGIPVGAKMAALNFAVVGPATSGHIVAYPSGTPVPGTSTVNFSGGEVAVANGSVVALTPNSGYGITVLVAGTQVNLIIDVTGYLQ
jgi:hypothetical protein